MSRHLGVLLTARCNLKCTHCLQDRHFNRDIDFDLLRRILAEARSAGIEGVSFAGGEPALYPHLPEAAGACEELGLTYSITTNGTVVEPLLMAASRHLPHHLTLSFEGTDRLSHDCIRGAGTFDRVLNTSRLLTGLGIPVRLQFTITDALTMNVAEYRRLLEETGAESIFFVPLVQTAGTDRAGIKAGADRLRLFKLWILTNRGSGLPLYLSLGDDIICDDDETPTISCDYLRGHSTFVNWNGAMALCCQTAGIDAVNSTVGGLQSAAFGELAKRRSIWIDEIIRRRRHFPAAFQCNSCHACLKES